MLISLKMMVLRRAKVIGHEDLADKFDLKMLRALGMFCIPYILLGKDLNQYVLISHLCVIHILQ